MLNFLQCTCALLADAQTGSSDTRLNSIGCIVQNGHFLEKAKAFIDRERSRNIAVQEHLSEKR